MRVKLPIQPMEPLLAEEPFQDEAFRYEVKWDGVRALVGIRDGALRIWLRKGKEIARCFPELDPLLADKKPVILDGELIVLDESNRPDFSRIVRRLRLQRPEAIEHARQTMPAVFMVFDLLQLGNHDLRPQPWRQRREILQQTVRPSAHVQLVESFADGFGLFQVTKQLGLEGIVAKRIDSRYVSGKRHRDWFKIKHFQEVEASIGGLQRKADGTWRSVYLGLPKEDGLLTFIGQAASGLTADDWNWLAQQARRLQRSSPPFVDLPAQASQQGDVWLQPELRATVRFQAWTGNGHLRSPVIKQLYRAALE